MSDVPKKGQGRPTPAPPPSSSPKRRATSDTSGDASGDGRLDAELDSIAELLDSGFGEALGDLLGAPPPLPPPPAEEQAKVASTPRASTQRPAATPLPQRPPTVPPAPTDEEVFGSLGGSSEFDEAFARVTGEPLRRSSPSSSSAGGGDEQFAEKTVIADVDDSLLEKARPSDLTLDKIERAAAPTPTPIPAPILRRGPAIVRRDRLSRDMPAVRGPEEYEGENATRIAEPGYAPRELEVAALAESQEAPPVASVELDESFYDGIEIGTAEETKEATETAAPARPSHVQQSARRITRNVVRRPSVEASRVMPAVAEAPAAPGGAQGAGADAPEDGFEASESLARTGIYVRPDEVGERTVVAPHGELSDMALAAAIDEVADPDRSGSSPLVDVFGDLDLSTGVPGPEEPLSGDLSVDLEGEEGGTIDEAAYAEADVRPLEEQLFAAEDDAEAAIEAALAETGEPAGDGSDAAAPSEVADEAVISEATAVAPPPPGAFLDETLDPARFALPENGPAIDAAGDGQVLGDLEREIEFDLAQPTDARRSARLHLYAGLAAAQAGDHERAEEHLDEASHADDQSLAAVRAQRRLLLLRGHFPEALRRLDRELELTSGVERMALAAFRADLLLAIGEQDLARVAYGELIDAQPDDLRSLLAQIELAYSDERDDELLEVLAAAERSIEDKPLVAAMAVLRARLLERQGRDDEAARSFDEALVASPGERTAHLGRARLALHHGQAAEATAHIDAFLAQAADPALLSAAGRRRAAADPGDATALRALEEAGAVEDPLVLDAMAAGYARTGQSAELLLALSGWAAAEPSPTRRAEILTQMAALQAGPLGDDAAAVRTLADIAGLDPDDSDVAEELVAANLRGGDTDAALAWVRTCAEADPSMAPWLSLRAAGILEAAGRPDEAAAELAAAAGGQSPEPIFVEAQARALAAAGQMAVLGSFLSATADAAAPSPLAARERAARVTEDAVDGSGDHIATAEEAWRAVLALEPRAVTAHAALARLAQARGDRAALAEALAGHATAVADPARQAALAFRRAALVDKPAAAREALEELLASAPLDARAAQRLVYLAGKDKLFADAANVMAVRSEALGAGTERDALRYRAAALLQDEEGDHARAAFLLGPTAENRPGFAGAALRLERAHRELSDGVAIAADLEREAKSDAATPELAAARWVRLAETIAGRVGDMARAAAAYREALSRSPSDPAVRDGFARVAVAANEVAPLADLALADLRAAEDKGDVRAKVAAYEELARVDGDFRGDIASATLAWESAITLDPARLPALRALERTYLGDASARGHGEQRTAELEVVYQKLGVALAQSPGDAVPVILERARILDKDGNAEGAIAAHREALTLGPSRMSLFKLDMRAREAGARQELAVLDERIAEYFAGTAGKADVRGQAAFLVRAGEILADLDQPDEAIARFRAAVTALPGFFPALRAWRRTALAAERWTDVVEAAELEAAAARTDGERARLLHLAGAAAMDRSNEAERAAASLRHVLALEPRHEDAFRRLRRLHEAAGQHAALAELLAARVEIEPHPGRLVEQHGTLAMLYRDRLGDPERAKGHLRAVLGRDPKHLDAVASLSDIAWAQGQWSEAAEALIVRARLEKDPVVLKETFFRLGVIYADKLPDARWATKSFERVLSFDGSDMRALEYLSTLSMASGDHRAALGATERLVALDATPATRVAHLQRIARIHEDGFHDRKRAEEALRRAIDADPTSIDALGAVVDFYTRAGDPASLRVNLDRIAANMRTRLASEPWDGVPYRVLGRALLARAATGMPASAQPGQAAAELAVAFGAGDDGDRAVAAQAQARAQGLQTGGGVARGLAGAQGPQTGGGVAPGLGGLGIDDQLFHPSIPNGFRQIFRLLYDTLSKRFPPDLRRGGVGKAERLPRAAHPVRDVVARLAIDLGIGDFDVYLSTAKPNLVAVEMTDPLSVIIGAQIATLGTSAIRFAAGRAIKLALSYMSVPALLGPDELGVLLAAVIRQYDPAFAPAGMNLAAVTEETQRLARLIPKRMRDEIQRFAAEVSGVAIDRHGLWLGVQHTGNRAGLLASGSAQAALNVLLRTGGHATMLAGHGDPQIEEMLRFAVSNEHADLYAAAGGVGEGTGGL